MGASAAVITLYRDLAFFTRSPKPFTRPAQAELVAARSISIPEI